MRKEKIRIRNDKQINIRVDKQTFNNLKKIIRRLGITRSEFLRYAINSKTL